MWRYVKFLQIWQNFTFFCIYCVEKAEIPLHVEKFQISPHLSCIEIWNFSTWLIFLHLHIGDRGDKYQVCFHPFVPFKPFISYVPLIPFIPFATFCPPHPLCPLVLFAPSSPLAPFSFIPITIWSALLLEPTAWDQPNSIKKGLLKRLQGFENCSWEFLAVP